MGEGIGKPTQKCRYVRQNCVRGRFEWRWESATLREALKACRYAAKGGKMKEFDVQWWSWIEDFCNL